MSRDTDVMRPAEVVKPLVLVVDDQHANIQSVGAMLSRAGFDVMPATSGAQALQRVAVRAPALILLDVLMPEMDGFEVLRLLRAQLPLAAIPVIFLTAAHDRELLVRAFEAGAVDYLTKPFVTEELLARVRTHIELKQARDHLERIARERADLTQIVAHDLKGPLSGIQFSASLLRRQSLESSPRALRLIDSISESANEALHFIHGYLGRWADGELKRRLDAQSVPLQPLAARVVADYEAAAESRQMRIELEAVAAPTVSADAVATRHVLNNLVSNAIKYALPDSVIEVHLGPGRQGFGKVSVLDRGPGISESDQQKLFRRYVRLGNVDSGDFARSSGLGLAIAKQEVAQMGGHLWYEDRPGGGACFAFELPLDAGTPR